MVPTPVPTNDERRADEGLCPQAAADAFEREIGRRVAAEAAARITTPEALENAIAASCTGAKMTTSVNVISSEA